MSRENLWRKRQIILEPHLVERLYEWHGGQFTPTYSLASTGNHDLVSLSMIDAGIEDLNATLRSMKKAKVKGVDLEHLRETIGELEAIRQHWPESSAKEAGMDLDESEYEYDRVDYDLDEGEEKARA